MPSYLFDRINKGTHPRKIQVFVNTPSIEACHSLAFWMLDKDVIPAGCFVQINNSYTEKSWKYYSEMINLPFATSNKLPENFRIICDIPRPQNKPGTAIWNDGIIQCVENGYEWIHFPFSPTKANYAMVYNKEIFQSLADQSNIINALEEEKSHYGEKPEFFTYKSHWGATSTFYWKPFEQQWEFNGLVLSQRSVSGS
eukprot:15346427-Ditylum_brightwellii.AAC.2